MAGTRALPAVWKWIFRFEILVVLGTVLYWTFAPGDYFAALFPDSYGKAEDDVRLFLLLQGANVVFCCYVYFYARILFADEKTFSMRWFGYLQECMAIGDVIVIALAVWLRPTLTQKSVATYWTMVFMAALWGAIRLAFLWREVWFASARGNKPQKKR